MHYFNNLQIDIILFERAIVSDQWGSLRPMIDPFNRFYYIVKGNAEVILNRRTIHLKEDNGYILPAGVPLQLIRPAEPFEQVYVHFNASLPGGIEVFRFLEFPNVIPGDQLQQVLPADWMVWFTGTDYEDIVRDLNREALLRLLVCPFIAEGIKRDPEKHRAMERFENVISYIERHYQEQIKVGDLAEMAFLQPTYFSNTFAKHFGVAPQRYICQVRINKAQHLLEHGDRPIKEIAEQVGYEDELYFSRLFKNYVGMPPTVYRQQRKLNPY